MRKITIIINIVMMCLYASAQDMTIKLWENGVPGSKQDTSYKETTILNKQRPRILKVTDPEIQIFIPDTNISTGTAILICPGGGYERLAIDHEGWDVAKWLNSMGITGIVLKYRLPSDAIMIDKTIGPLQDVQEAIRTIRRNAAKWNIDPNKIGVIGFSAGGHVAGIASTMYNEKVYNTDTISARPDFSILIYSVLSMQSFTHSGSKKNLLGDAPSQELTDKFSNELHVNKQTPPAFLVHSQDDKSVPVENSIRYFQALIKNSIPAELHIYEKGGHGYGLATDRETTESSWPDACKKWLNQMGLR
ncbi:MAG: alpha/beta hydrolase [Bacteroidales bacterium]